LVGVAINNNHCMPLHAHTENEEKRFHKKQGCGGHCYTKCGKGSLYSTHPCVPTNPWEWWNLGCTKPTLSLMQWNSHSPKYFVAHVNGHCKRTCVNTKLWWFSNAWILLKMISFITMEHGMDHILEGCSSHSHWVLVEVQLTTFWSFYFCMAMASPKMRTFILTWFWSWRPFSEVKDLLGLTFFATKPCTSFKCFG